MKGGLSPAYTNAKLPEGTRRTHVFLYGRNVPTRSYSLPRTIKERVTRLRGSIDKVRISYPYSVEAWVLLPDHMHCIWRIPEGDSDYSIRWALIKKEFTNRAKTWLSLPDASRKKHREAMVWQRRFWEYMITDERDFSVHCDYIHPYLFYGNRKELEEKNIEPVGIWS